MQAVESESRAAKLQQALRLAQRVRLGLRAAAQVASPPPAQGPVPRLQQMPQCRHRQTFSWRAAWQLSCLLVLRHQRRRPASLTSWVSQRQVRALDPFLRRDDARDLLVLRPCSTTATTHRYQSSCRDRRRPWTTCRALWRAQRRERFCSSGWALRHWRCGVLDGETGGFALTLYVETQTAELSSELGVDAGATNGQ